MFDSSVYFNGYTFVHDVDSFPCRWFQILHRLLIHWILKWVVLMFWQYSPVPNNRGGGFNKMGGGGGGGLTDTLNINKQGSPNERGVWKLFWARNGKPLPLITGIAVAKSLSWATAWLLVTCVCPVTCLPLLHFWCLVSLLFMKNESLYSRLKED